MRKFSVRPSPVPFSEYTKNPFFFETGLIIGLDPLVLVEMRDMHGTTRYPAQLFKCRYEAEAEEEQAPLQMPEFCVSLPRIFITPSRVCVTGFEVEMSNRVTRKFIEEKRFSGEAFIKVIIGDDNGDKLYSDVNLKIRPLS